MPFTRAAKTPEIQIEEIISGGGDSGEFLELSLTGKVFKLFYVGVVAVVLIYLGWISYLWQTKGSFFEQRALANANHEEIIPAARGVILDRFGTPLAENQPIFSVSLKVSEYLKRRGEIDTFLNESIGLTKEDIDAVLAKTDLLAADSITIARDLEPDQILRLRARDLPGVEVSDDFRRSYPKGDAFAHILGYADFESNGRTGLELYYDNILRGKGGLVLNLKNSKGEMLSDETVKHPENGKPLTTTIDAEFEQYFHDRVSEGLASLGRTRAAGLAIDPRNGEVLAMVSLPTYDNNLFTKKGSKEDSAARQKLLTAPDSPMFNRVMSGIYNPGSTMKPLHAIAVLNEGIATPQTSIYSPGYIDLPNPYDPEKPSRFLDWRAHGWVNVYSALARSSDVYFYEVIGGFETQRGLGIEKLISWWKKFRLGEKTGADFPNEAAGFLPNPDEKEKRTGTFWRIGDTYNVSIGQGDLAVTPIELLNAITLVANGGRIYVPRFNKDLKATVATDMSDLASEIDDVRIGMLDAVRKPYGTANLLYDLPYRTAGKTGSAQVENNTKTNAFFVGYGPAKDPLVNDDATEAQVAVLVLIENAKEGSLNVVPIAKDVLNWYYEHRVTR